MDKSLVDILIEIKMLESGIIPYSIRPGGIDINKALTEMTEKDRREAKRKFRKLWRKASKKAHSSKHSDQKSKEKVPTAIDRSRRRNLVWETIMIEASCEISQTKKK